MKFFASLQMTKCLFIFMLFFWGCAPTSMNDFQHEGEARCRILIKELEKIETREQLLCAEVRLKKHFEALVDLMIAAREFQRSHMDDIPNEIENPVEVLLQEQLRRIYSIESGREIIERSQQEALVRLDANERAQTKKNSKIKTSAKSRH